MIRFSTSSRRRPGVMPPPPLGAPLLALLALLLALPAAMPASAQVRVLPFQEMVASAGMIFIGTVSDVRGGTDEHGDIVTYTTFRVEQPIRGVSGSTITVKQLGGQAGGQGVKIAHMRYFAAGEKVLVMFYPVSDLGFTSPVGLNQGVWSVAADGGILVDPAMQGALSRLGQEQKVKIGGGRVVPRAAMVSLIRKIGKGGSAR